MSLMHVEKTNIQHRFSVAKADKIKLARGCLQTAEMYFIRKTRNLF